MERTLAALKLLLDLDGTTLKNAGREVMARELNLPIPPGNSGSWLSSGVLEERGISMEQFWAVWHANQGEIYSRAIPLPGAIETLHALKARGAEIAIVTARRESAAGVTEDWLALYGVPYDSIAFSCDDKLAVARSLGLNMAIDDDVKHVLALSQELPVMLMDADERHELLELPTNVTRISTWAQVPAIVENLRLGAAG